jgi:hypothetical protein
VFKPKIWLLPLRRRRRRRRPWPQRYNVTRPVKKADTYRLPLDAHALIRAEIADAAENGNRLTKDDVVTKALRALYGKKHDSATIDHFIAEIESGMKK